MNRLSALGARLSALTVLLIGFGCAHARVDPQFSAEPRLEATIEALGEEIARLRLQRDSLTVATESLTATMDSLQAELARLRLELQRIKDIDLRRKQARPRL